MSVIHLNCQGRPTPEEAYQRANDYQVAGRLREAEFLLLKLLEVLPRHAHALHLLGVVAWQSGQAERALRLIHEAIAIEPEGALFHSNLAEMSRQRGRLPEAILHGERAVALDASSAGALANLGVAFFDAGDYDKAEACHLKALDIAPGFLPSVNNLGSIRRARGDRPGAVAWFHKALEITPDFLPALSNLGALLVEEKRADEAAVYLEKALALQPNHPEALCNLGLVRFLQQRLVEAEAALKAGIRLNSSRGGTAAARHALGRILVMGARLAEARAVFQDWLVLEPENPVATHFLAAVSENPPPTRAHDDYVVAEFDHFADSFDEKLSSLGYRAPELVAKAVARLFPEPRPTLRILDAGCGTGLCAPFLLPWAGHLAGVDLSSAMVAKARARGGYQELHVAELTAFLAGCRSDYDLIVSADTLCYFGDLTSLCGHAYNALAPKRGAFIFSVEALAETFGMGYRLNSTGRYSHTESCVRAVLQKAGFETVEIETGILRFESKQAVDGFIVSANFSGVPGQSRLSC